MAALEAINKIFGQDQAANAYRGVVNTGYQNLGQPGDAPDRNDTTNKFITSLASTYADRIMAKTGKLPSEDEIRQYVAQNATAGNAEKFVTGNLNTDQMNTMADYHIQANPTGQQGQVDDLYDKQRQNLSSAIESAYMPVRKAAIEDEAALGRLRSPASIESIGNVDAQKAQSLSQALAGTYGNQAQAEQQANQFGQTLGLQNREFMAAQDDTSFNRGLQRQQLSLASQLGRMQGGGGDNGMSGALGGGLSGAATGAAIGSVVPGLGTALGAGIGGLAGLGMGYFGSKRR